MQRTFKMSDMNRMGLSFLIGFMLISNLIYGQHHTTTVIPAISKRFKVGDMYYASSYKGLQLFMTDIEFDNPDLYSKLAPAFKDIESKRKNALISFVSGGIVGTTFVVGGFTFLQKTRIDESIFDPGTPFYEPPQEVKEWNVDALLGGFGCYLVSGIVGMLLSPNEADIYNFINLNNRYNPDQKMDWEIGMDFSQNKEFGLKLTMNF
jgi:hypothetical protein